MSSRIGSGGGAAKVTAPSGRTNASGARWARAALQVNPFSYKGAVQPSARFADEAAYNEALLDKCVELGVEIIAITDHWCVDTAKTLIDAATERGIAALPGFEANSAEGVHVLVIFEVGTALSDVTAAIGECGGTPGCDNGTTGISIQELLAKMAKRGALVIPAHVNVAKAGLFHRLEGNPLVNAVTDPHLHVIAVTPSQPSLQAQEDVIARRNPYARKHSLAVIYADDISDPAALEGAGATTWFKLSSRSLSSIKHAVRTPDTRIALDDPSSAHRAVIR